jgi:hypothetical protein
LDKLFKKGKNKDDEQRHRFLANMHLEIKKLCMVRTYANVEMLAICSMSSTIKENC